MNTWVEKLVELGAEKEFIEWTRSYSSLDEAWKVCTNGTWMMWLIYKTSNDLAKVMPVPEVSRLSKTVLNYVNTHEEKYLYDLADIVRNAYPKAPKI